MKRLIRRFSLPLLQAMARQPRLLQQGPFQCHLARAIRTNGIPIVSAGQASGRLERSERATFSASTTRMSNSTLPRTNISLLGATNMGKSVLMNLLTQSDTSLVHDTAGTTADPKVCLMELHGKIGPIRLFDTPGINEGGELGTLKREKAHKTIGQCDVAVIVADPFAKDRASTVTCAVNLIQEVHRRQAMNQKVSATEASPPFCSPVPLLIFNTRSDEVKLLESSGGSLSIHIEQIEKDIEEELVNNFDAGDKQKTATPSLPPSLSVDLASQEASSRDRVIQFLERHARPRSKAVSLLPGSLAQDNHMHGDSPTVFLNIPMDQQTPSMRLLRPQAMVQEALIRNFASTLSFRMDLGLARSSSPLEVAQEKDCFLRALEPLRRSGDLSLLITDSQAIDVVAPWTVDDNGEELVPITTFSITMIRYLSGGRLDLFTEGLRKLDRMIAHEDSPVSGQHWRILISEACNHTRLNLEKECADIGTVQLPNHLASVLGSDNVEFEYAFGKHALFDPSRYDLVIQCGGCMLTPQAMEARVADLADAGVPATNYGLLLARIQSPEALARVLRPWGC